MERVTFLIEKTGARVSCLLNPERLETRRSAGVMRRRGAGGVLLGGARSDDPLIATGGGVTEYDLSLLFDVDVANEGRAPPPVDPADPAVLPPPALVSDVRALTQPLWALSENATSDAGPGAPPAVRFIWGKSWNVPGIVLAVAERLERFDGNGVPGRSWLSMRLRRVEEATPTPALAAPTSPQFEPPASGGGGGAAEDQDLETFEVPVDADGVPMEQLDQTSARIYGDPALARYVAERNGLDDMLRLDEGVVLRLPSAARLRLGTP